MASTEQGARRAVMAGNGAVTETTSSIGTNEALMGNGLLSLKLTLLMFALCLSGGCAHLAMDSVIGSWQGRQVDEVITAWGKPTEEMQLEGKRVLIWRTDDGRLAASAAKTFASPAAGYCVRLLHADRKGRIVDGTWDGNDCPGWFSGWSR